MAKRIKLVCNTCGGDDITFDASARWNVETQEYEMTGLYDNKDCQDCGGECHTEAVELGV